ncbi:MAG: glycosyltransferase family 39 protein [Lachnospiraceae bacterium]|nr:glycosyltransferase family 39 protein [Lachnospiraceae bacterium]
MARTFQRKIQKLMGIPYVLLILFLTIVILFGWIHPDSYGELENAWPLIKRVVMMTAGVGVFMCLSAAAFHLTDKLSGKKAALCLGILSVVAFFLQLLLILRYPLQIWWDNTSVLTSAISVVTGDRSCFDVIYFNQVGHQNCFLLLTAALVAVAGFFGIDSAGYTIWFSLIDLFAVDLAIALTLLTVKRLRGASSAKRLWLVILLCPGIYLWSGYYYTTNLSLLFIAGWFYLVSLAWEKKRHPLFYFGLGLFAAFGMQLRATVMLAVIATVIVAFFKTPKAPLRAALCTAAGIAVMLGLLNLTYEKMNPDYSKDARFPVTHWLMMGAQGNGEYSDADLEFTSSFETAEEKSAATKAEYIRRLKEAGPVGIAALAFRKTTHNWSYGNHSYYPLFHRYDRLSDLLFTPDHQILFYLEQVYHLSLLLLVLVGLLLRMTKLWGGKKDGAEEFAVEMEDAIRIALLGGFCFYLLWETFPYYSVGFLGVLWYLSSGGCDLLSGVVSKPSRGKTVPLAALGIALALSLPIGYVLVKTAWPVITKPVVTQKKLNTMLSLKDVDKAEQTFVASRPFDTISFWIGKGDQGNPAGGRYEIVLSGQESGEVLRETYDTEGMARVDEYTRTFPRVECKPGEHFSLTVEKQGEDNGNPLTLGGYDLPVEAYMYGELLFDGRLQESELFFTVTDGGPDSVIRLYE